MMKLHFPQCPTSAQEQSARTSIPRRGAAAQERLNTCPVLGKFPHLMPFPPNPPPTPMQTLPASPRVHFPSFQTICKVASTNTSKYDHHLAAHSSPCASTGQPPSNPVTEPRFRAGRTPLSNTFSYLVTLSFSGLSTFESLRSNWWLQLLDESLGSAVVGNCAGKFRAGEVPWQSSRAARSSSTCLSLRSIPLKNPAHRNPLFCRGPLSLHFLFRIQETRDGAVVDALTLCYLSGSVLPRIRALHPVRNDRVDKIIPVQSKLAFGEPPT